MIPLLSLNSKTKAMHLNRFDRTILTGHLKERHQGNEEKLLADTESLRLDILKAVRSADLATDLLKFGLLHVSKLTAEDWLKTYSLVQESPFMNQVSFSPRRYLHPISFTSAVYLGSGTTEQIVPRSTLSPYRHSLEKQGFQFRGVEKTHAIQAAMLCNDALVSRSIGPKESLRISRTLQLQLIAKSISASEPLEIEVNGSVAFSDKELVRSELNNLGTSVVSLEHAGDDGFDFPRFVAVVRITNYNQIFSLLNLDRVKNITDMQGKMATKPYFSPLSVSSLDKVKSRLSGAIHRSEFRGFFKGDIRVLLKDTADINAFKQKFKDHQINQAQSDLAARTIDLHIQSLEQLGEVLSSFMVESADLR